ncbi:MAG: FKBP-type peptidyl-prolyl cis-trans isomerase [Bacteroidota bacterium]|nr:FKBP-type peptidyl-prolyl cis-trans isomerase [Bacteroidota bacterium]
MIGKNKIHALLCGIFALIGFYSCTKKELREDGFSVADNGLYYKLCEIGEGQKNPEEGDLVLLNVNFRTQKDSLFFDSRHNAWMGYFLKVDNSKRGFQSYLDAMLEGDSLVFMVNSKVFFREVFDSELPFFSKNDTIVKAEIRLMAIMDSSEMNAYNYSKLLELKENSVNEGEQILNFAKANWKEFDSIPEQLLFKKLISTKDSSVIEGKTVSIKYTGFFLDGRIFDNAQSSKPFDFTYGSQQQLLPGLQIALGVMHKGEIAKFILPSHLAFGEQGSSGIVPPYAPLVYEVEVVDVK